MSITATPATTTTAAPDLEVLKSRLKATWSAGDFGRIAKNLEASAARFLARIPVAPGERLLDLACGTGQVAIPAARAGARATGVDIAPNLIAQARARAEAERLDVRFDEGDAESLPYGQASFDLIVSLIGAMFAPRPERVAAEMVRVCRPGGRIVMGNWTRDGFIGRMLKTVGRHLPSPAGMPSPLLWGDEATVRERLSRGISNLQLTQTTFLFRYPFPAAAVVDHYREFYGPVNRAFAALDTHGQRALHDDLTELWGTHNEEDDGTTYVEAEILEVVAVRQ